MSKLLISVRSTEEAMLARSCGADFIDLKEPHNGALGDLDLAITKDILAALEGKSVVSATLGDLPMQPDVISKAIEARLSLGIDYLKVGFFPSDAIDYSPCINVLNEYAINGNKIIIVIFADHDYPEYLIDDIIDSKIAGLMVDTDNKANGTLLNFYSIERLEMLSQKVKQSDKLFGVAGSLRLEHVEKLKKTSPDYMGFRGGVCSQGQRNASLNPAQIQAISKAL